MITKKIIPLLFGLIFGFYCAQVGNHITTKDSIDSEIKKAKMLTVNDPNKSIALATKLYKISKDKGYKKGMLECDNILMAKFFDAGNLKKVVEISKEAEILAKETNDMVILSNIYKLRGSSYTELGFNDESLKEFNKSLDIAEKIESKNDKNYQKAITFIGISTYYGHINAPIDSVINYQKKSLEAALLIDENKYFINKKYFTIMLSYINLGKTSVAQNRPKDAEIYFSKALEISENKKYIINKELKVTVPTEFAWLYYDQKKYDKAKSFAKQAETLERGVGLPYIRRDIYEVYFKSCVELGEKEVSKKYMNLYTKLNDSLVNVEKKAINTPVKHIIDEKEEVYTNDIQKIIMTASGIIVALLLAGWFFWKQNQNKLHKRYKTIIENLKNEEKTSQIEPVLVEIEDKSPENIINISEDTTTSLLNKLSKFEKSEKFLKNDISLSSLSTSLNTNPRYLSEIIKQHKGKNFNNYLHGLRIHYITNKLYETPVFREYKISYLAEYCGFSSREVFAVIFKKETGVTPSYFINQLKKDDVKQEAI